MLNLFFAATLCLLNLSSGEKRAGCADSVTFPSGFDFYLVSHQVVGMMAKSLCVVGRLKQ